MSDSIPTSASWNKLHSIWFDLHEESKEPKSLGSKHSFLCCRRKALCSSSSILAPSAAGAQTGFKTLSLIPLLPLWVYRFVCLRASPDQGRGGNLQFHLQNFWHWMKLTPTSWNQNSAAEYAHGRYEHHGFHQCSWAEGTLEGEQEWNIQCLVSLWQYLTTLHKLQESVLSILLFLWEAG